MRTYGDGCGIAHALDIVGERWALLVVRELLLGPKRFVDLRGGLPGASTNVLSQRLRQLEQAAIVQRRKLPPPAGSSVYELTDWGRELKPMLLSLGTWAARSPVVPRGRPRGHRLRRPRARHVLRRRRGRRSGRALRAAARRQHLPRPHRRRGDRGRSRRRRAPRRDRRIRPQHLQRRGLERPRPRRGTARRRPHDRGRPARRGDACSGSSRSPRGLPLRNDSVTVARWQTAHRTTLGA